MNGLYLTMVMIGNYLGPVAAGYVAVSQPWRWAFWYCAIFMGITSLAMSFFLEESKYIPNGYRAQVDFPGPALSTLDEQGDLNKTQRTTLDNTSGHDEPANGQRLRHVPIDITVPTHPYWVRHAFYSTEKHVTLERRNFWMHLYQPFQILFTFPAIMFAALQYGFLIAMLGVLAVTQATLYAQPPYNFSTAGVGNMNIPPAVGAILGSIFGGPLNDYFIILAAKRRKGIYEPETRLWLFMIPGICMPIGLFLYGLTIAKVSYFCYQPSFMLTITQGMHWAYNAIGAGLIGAAIGGCGDIALTYCQDSYQDVSKTSDDHQKSICRSRVADWIKRY